MNWRTWLLGNAHFNDGEEYAAFQYMFALAMLWVNLPLLLLFISGDLSGANPLGPHGLTARAYLGLCVLLILLLRGHRERYRPLIWVFAFASLGVHLSGLVFIPQDESRLVWFYSLVVGAYVLLGQRAGALLTLLSLAVVALGNHITALPYSARSLLTFDVSLVAMSVIFHVFTSRSLSFHRAMVQSQARLRHLSDHDPLTGLPNARSFAQQADALIRLGQRQGSPCAMLFIDLDHFKRINDRHGHGTGDRVLQAVAAALRQRLRRTDVLGRIGGEEFVAFLPDTAGPGALQLAEALRADIDALPLMSDNGRALHITASLGVAVRPGGSHSLADLQREADHAMYAAKAAGRNRVQGPSPQGDPLAGPGPGPALGWQARS